LRSGLRRSSGGGRERNGGKKEGEEIAEPTGKNEAKESARVGRKES